MPEWSAEVWGIIVSGLIGFLGIMVGGIALFKSHTANKHAAEANQIAKQALQVQERGVDVAVSSEERSRRADIRVTSGVMLMQRDQRARIGIENRGPHDAEDVTLTLHYGAGAFEFGRVPRLQPDEGFSILQNVTSPLSELDSSTAQELELRATYRDGNGPRTDRWRVTIGPGERFVDRGWSVSNWPDAG